MAPKKPRPAIGSRPPREQFMVVSYDIANNRRRQKVVKIMEGYGRRVQYSVFECRLSARNYRRLREKLSAVIDPQKDSILFYPLCGGCLQKREGLGLGKPSSDQEHWVI